MSWDERIEFLMKSHETLHSDIHALYEAARKNYEAAQKNTEEMREQTAQMKEHTAQLKEHTKQLEIDAENIRALARIAGAHQERISDLERPEA